MNFIDKIFGRVECYKCKKKFKKTKNTTCGFTNEKSFYMCPTCSIDVIDKAFKGENLFEEKIKMKTNSAEKIKKYLIEFKKRYERDKDFLSSKYHEGRYNLIKLLLYGNLH